MTNTELIKLLDRQIELRREINETRGPVLDRVFIDGHTIQNPDSAYNQQITSVQIADLEKLDMFVNALGIGLSNYDDLKYFIYKDAMIFALEEDNEHDTI